MHSIHVLFWQSAVSQPSAYYK